MGSPAALMVLQAKYSVGDRVLVQDPSKPRSFLRAEVIECLSVSLGVADRGRDLISCTVGRERDPLSSEGVRGRLAHVHHFQGEVWLQLRGRGE